MTTCEQGNRYLSEAHGKAWEHYRLGDNYVFSNQIPNRQSWTRTHAGWILHDHGYCQWGSSPPARTPEQELEPVAETRPAAPISMSLPTPEGSMTDGGFGVLVLLAAIAAAGWWWMQRGKQPDPDYDPHHDLDIALPLIASQPVEVEYLEIEDGEPVPAGYVLVEDEDDREDGDGHPKPQGNQPHGIPSVEPCEFASNSHEFASNSQNGQSANSHGIPQVSADSHNWPPKSMGTPYDPLQSEQPGEFERYRQVIEQDGLNPKGNPIIKEIWGCTPGRSSAYEAARKRRDRFAKRLNYYKFEDI